jgi:hypothetical protein
MGRSRGALSRRLAWLWLVALSTALGTYSSAHAGTVIATGTILLPSPQSGFPGGFTEIGGRCDPSSPLQGLDGAWVVLPEGSSGMAITLTGSAGSDMDGYFYDAECALIPNFDLAKRPAGRNEVAVVPSDAAFVVVDQFDGVNGTYTLILG